MKKSSITIKTTITLLLLLAIVFAFSSSYAATAWVNQNSSWETQGCRLNVQDKNTGKWSAGIFHYNFENDVTWNDAVSIGDKLYIDAYTCYNGGKLWVYEDDVCVREIDAGYQEHIYLDWTVTANKTRIACSASGYARLGEQLSVTINAIGDNQAPTVTIAKPYVALNPATGRTLASNCSATNATINLSDNKGVTGYYVSTNSAKPSATASGWTTISASTSTSKTYTPTAAGVYYVYAKDAVNNISNVASFEAGYLPEVPKPADVIVKTTETASFVGAPSRATAPYTYQWYKNTSNAISGAKNSTYSFTTSEADNNCYFSCEVTNRFGSTKSDAAKLTVYYPHEVTINITDHDVNFDQRNLSIPVTFTKQGNTNSYTYQWYKASSQTATGTRIVGATSNPYVYTPTGNESNWFYCEVANVRPNGTVLYTKRTNSVQVTSDITKPTIELVSVTPSPENMNKNATLTIKLKVSDTGEGYTENGSNFTGSDIKVIVKNTEQTGASRNLVYTSSTGDDHLYTLTLTNVTGDGNLSLKIPANSIADRYGNKNVETPIEFSPVIYVDNTLPRIDEAKCSVIKTTNTDPEKQQVIDQTNNKYINKYKTITARIVIAEDIKYNSNELTADDLVVKVGGTAFSSATKEVSYEGEVTSSISGFKGYSYLVTLGNIEGDGALALNLPAGKIKDDAKNENASQDVPLKLNGTQLIVDNTAPQVSLSTRLGGFADDGATFNYTSQLSSWHDNWAREDVYVTVNVTDTNATAVGDRIYRFCTKDDFIDSRSLTNTYRDRLTDELDQDVYYRVYDQAGNYTTKSVNIKIDKTPPEATKAGIYELRMNGAEYIYVETQPSNKTLYVKALDRVDSGRIKSGVETNSEALNTATSQSGATLNDIPSEYKMDISGATYGTYYVITRYNNPTDKDVIDSWSYKIEDQAQALVEDGYYEVITTTTDNAGNTTRSEPFKIIIKKRADNTIRITNMNDMGSGLNKLVINVYKGNESDVTIGSNGIVTDGTKAIKTIEVNNPYKEYSSTMRLGRGEFYVEAVLYDNVGLFNVYKKVINNDL